MDDKPIRGDKCLELQSILAFVAVVNGLLRQNLASTIVSWLAVAGKFLVLCRQ